MSPRGFLAPIPRLLTAPRSGSRLDFNEPDLDDSDGGYSEWDETAAGGDDELTQDSTELSNGNYRLGAARMELAAAVETEFCMVRSDES